MEQMCTVRVRGHGSAKINRAIFHHPVCHTSSVRPGRASHAMDNIDAFDDALSDLDAAGQLSGPENFTSTCDVHSACSASAQQERAPVPISCSPASRPYETSLKVFRRHLALSSGAEVVGDVTSLACYEDWLSTRARPPNEPEKTFQRILTCTVSGTDGRTPFTPEEEEKILKQIRLKRVWPAFADSSFIVGVKGFRSCVVVPFSVQYARTLTLPSRQVRFSRKDPASTEW